ncbi:BACON domain-containing protein [Bacteroides gallinarum]|uniref:BACON domain-containing protein n=1 Tax=Bacteroides gallinarum TaxID=376806 RepID=UPI0003AAAD8D|nr:BACON domain-containing protein [Bacteroides gallinarum]
MKYLSKITLGLILCMGFITSCKDDDEPAIAGGIAVDKEEITIGPEGGTESVAVSSYSNWVASASKPWIAVSPANGIGSADCTLAIDSTLENTSRTSQVRFSLDGQEPKVITITQFGFGKQILLKESEIEIENSAEYDKRYFDVTISTNVNFKIDENIVYSFAEESMTEEEKNEVESESKDWLTMPKDSELEVNLDRKARPRTIKARFRWEMNTAPYTRIAKIKLVPENPEEDQLVDNDGNPIESVLLTVTQKPALKIEDNRSGDSLAIVTINEKIQSMITFDTSESMQNWDYVTLWEATDENLPEAEAVGRVRSLQLMMFDLKDGETLPKEIRYLKYLESFTIQSNTNRQTRTVSLGEEICDLKYLKNLSVISYGMNKLPDNFINLGDKLETLNLGSNNFTSLADIMEVVNEKEFKKLHSLTLTGCRLTDSYYDLSPKDKNKEDLGLHINISSETRERQAFLDLLTWDNLRSLQLSYNFIEGKLPDDDEVDAALTAAGKRTRYDESDFSTNENDYLDKLVGDTCRWLLSENNTVKIKYTNSETPEDVTGQEIPRVLPKAREFYINLNFLTGSLPKWILFHPHFVEWYPEGMVFNQQEDGRNSEGEKVGFDNINADKFDYSYYYGSEAPDSPTEQGVAYPLYYYRYVANASTTE